jgi:catalase
VAAGLGIRDLPPPLPKVIDRDVTPEVAISSALSLFARPGDGRIAARRIAILVEDGCDGAALRALADRLALEGAVPKFLAARLGAVETASGEPLEVDASLEVSPSVLFDAVVLSGGPAAVRLAGDALVLEFVKDQFRHCKTIFAIEEGTGVLAAAGVPTTLPGGEADPGLVLGATAADGATAFIGGVAQHRHFARETDPPRI